MLDTEDLTEYSGKHCAVTEGEVAPCEPPKDDEIIMIVGARWPQPLRGALRFYCDKCGKYVSLAPKTVTKVLKPNLRRPIICLECLPVIDEILDPMTDDEGHAYMLKLSEKRNGGPVV